MFLKEPFKLILKSYFLLYFLCTLDVIKSLETCYIIFWLKDHAPCSLTFIYKNSCLNSLWLKILVPIINFYCVRFSTLESHIACQILFKMSHVIYVIWLFNWHFSVTSSGLFFIFGFPLVGLGSWYHLEVFK